MAVEVEISTETIREVLAEEEKLLRLLIAAWVGPILLGFSKFEIIQKLPDDQKEIYNFTLWLFLAALLLAVFAIAKCLDFRKVSLLTKTVTQDGVLRFYSGFRVYRIFSGALGFGGYSLTILLLSKILGVIS